MGRRGGRRAVGQLGVGSFLIITASDLVRLSKEGGTHSSILEAGFNCDKLAELSPRTGPQTTTSRCAATPVCSDSYPQLTTRVPGLDVQTATEAANVISNSGCLAQSGLSPWVASDMRNQNVWQGTRQTCG